MTGAPGAGNPPTRRVVRRGDFRLPQRTLGAYIVAS